MPTPIQTAIETLSEELKQRKAVDEDPALEAAIWQVYRIAKKPMLLLVAVFKRPMLSYDVAASLLFSYRERNLAGGNSMAQHMCFVRRALKPDGIFIDNIHGRGWLMDEKNKARLRAKLGLN